jgi:hypothetical protein
MPAEPTRGDDGNILPHDHPEILSEHHVIRHTTPQDLHTDLQTGLGRISSGAYSESSDINGGMSVDIEDWMIAAGLPPLHYVSDATHGAVRLNVGELRAKGFQVGWDPLPENPHHGAVWGIGNGSKRRRRVAALATTIQKTQGES